MVRIIFLTNQGRTVYGGWYGDVGDACRDLDGGDALAGFFRNSGGESIVEIRIVLQEPMSAEGG